MIGTDFTRLFPLRARRRTLVLREYSAGHNRANDLGKDLEEYIKDLFAGTVNETNDQNRNIALSKAFSYLGNQNNPPDAMLRGGDDRVCRSFGNVLP